MLFLKFLLTIGGTGMMLVAAGILTHDLAMEIRYRRAFESDADLCLQFPGLAGVPRLHSPCWAGRR